MTFIALFCPAVFCVKIRMRRKTANYNNLIDIIIEFFMDVLVANAIAVSFCTFVIGYGDFSVLRLNDFKIFCKYVALSSIVSVIWPYIWEVLCKIFSVKFEIKKEDGNE